MSEAFGVADQLTLTAGVAAIAFDLRHILFTNVLAVVAAIVGIAAFRAYTQFVSAFVFVCHNRCPPVAGFTLQRMCLF
jgi:hypothetical protein